MSLTTSWATAMTFRSTAQPSQTMCSKVSCPAHKGQTNTLSPIAQLMLVPLAPSFTANTETDWPQNAPEEGEAETEAGAGDGEKADEAGADTAAGAVKSGPSAAGAASPRVKKSAEVKTPIKVVDEQGNLVPIAGTPCAVTVRLSTGSDVVVDSGMNGQWESQKFLLLSSTALLFANLSAAHPTEMHLSSAISFRLLHPC